MPAPGKRWYHVTLGTYNSWLPGDPRGFRSRHHGLHSSGDHKNPPPPGEHAGLHRYARSITGDPVFIPPDLRQPVCEGIVESLRKHKHRTLIACVDATHAHLLVELPEPTAEAKGAVGVAKKSASHRVSKQINGRVWCRGCGLKAITDESHQRNTYRYIERHAKDGAFVWTFQNDTTQGD